MTIYTFCSAMILTMFLVISIYDFYSLFYSMERVRSKRLLIISFFLFYGVNVWMELYEMPIEYNLIMLYSVLLLMTFCYRASIMSKLYGSILATVMIGASEMIVVFGMGLIWNTSYIELVNHQTIDLFLCSLTRLILFLMLKVVKVLSLRKKTKLDLGNQVKLSEYGMITILPLFSVALIHVLFLIARTLSSEYSVHVTIAILLILLLNVIFYYVYMKTLKLVEKESIFMLQEQQMVHYCNHYEELRRNLEEVHKFKHDVKYILMNAIEEFSSSSGIEDTKLMYYKLEKIIEGVYLETYQCYTSIPTLDMVLNYQVGKAKQNGVYFDIQIGDELMVTVEDKVLAIILGNSLDNAIEACATHDKKTVEIIIINKYDNLYISIANHYMGKLQFKEGLPITSKENKKLHGIGLKSIKQLVESNGGFLNISSSNERFCLQIMFYNG